MTEEATWIRIARDLCDQISSGDLPVGGAVPSREQLRARWGVAGGTARRAIDHLRTVGVLEGVPGRGVFVKRVPGPEDLDPRELPSTEQRIRALETRLDYLYRALGQSYPDETTD